jgi:phosphoribosyl 1,2-cyclic phosphate phosphodiesterase
MQRCGRSLAAIKTLVFTHQHSDHIAPQELEWMFPPFSLTPPAGVELFGNEEVIEIITHTLPKEKMGSFKLRLMEPLVPLVTAQGDRILPMPADHVLGALVLRIERNGTTLFYGHDSGLYPEPTLDALGAGPPLDIALFDSNNGGAPSSHRGHMGIDGVLRMTEELRCRGAVNERTRLIATHFSHNGLLLHEELVAAYLQHGIEVAYDGMLVRV